MSLQPIYGEDDGDPRSFNPTYEEGQQLINVRTNPAYMVQQQKRRDLFYGGASINPPPQREDLTKVPNDLLPSHSYVKWNMGEVLWHYKPWRSPAKSGILGAPQGQADVCITATSNLAYFPDLATGASAATKRLRLLEQLDCLGMGHNVPSSADRQGRGTSQVGGLITVKANGTQGFIEGEYVMAVIALPDQLKHGAGREDAVSGERPVAWLMPVNPGQLDPQTASVGVAALHEVFLYYEQFKARFGAAATDAEKEAVAKEARHHPCCHLTHTGLPRRQVS